MTMMIKSLTVLDFLAPAKIIREFAIIAIMQANTEVWPRVSVISET